MTGKPVTDRPLPSLATARRAEAKAREFLWDHLGLMVPQGIPAAPDPDLVARIRDWLERASIDDIKAIRIQGAPMLRELERTIDLLVEQRQRLRGKIVKASSHRAAIAAYAKGMKVN
jgi:hypothetical protein